MANQGLPTYCMGQNERHQDNQRSKLGIRKNCKIKINHMQIPRGKARKTQISEVSHQIGLFNYSKNWEPVAIHMLQVLLPLVFQKPSFK